MDGSYIAKARKARGLSQAKLADAIGLSVSQISRYETNQKVPTVVEVEGLARFLGVPFLSLIGPYDGLAEEAPKPETDELFHILTLVVSALLEAWEVPRERVQSFVSSLVAAYETPEALSPSIPSEQQIHFLTKSLVREYDYLRRPQKRQK